MQKLLGYSFSIEYKTGTSNQAADALSRREEEENLSSVMLLLSRPMSHILQQLLEENSSLTELKELQAKFDAGNLSKLYTRKDVILMYNDRFFIRTGSTLKIPLLEEFYSSQTAGYGGLKTTLMRLSHLFYWPRMQQDVKGFVEKCFTCQQMKFSTQAPAGLLQPLPIPSMVWDELTMDFINGLPKSRGYTAIG